MKFRYFKFPLLRRSDFFGTSILKPIIPVKIAVLKTGKGVRYAALIDSGADFCIFDGAIGEALGLDVRFGRPEQFAGIQSTDGRATAFLHEVVLDIGGWLKPTIVGFSYDIAPHGYGILGQRGFFDIFVVKFDLLKEEIELKPRQQ